MNWNAAPASTIENLLSSDSADEQNFIGTISNPLSRVSLSFCRGIASYFRFWIHFILHCDMSSSSNFCIQPSLFCRSCCFNNWVTAAWGELSSHSCFPGLASPFSSSYNFAAFPSQLLYSSVSSPCSDSCHHFNDWVKRTWQEVGRTVDRYVDSMSKFIECHAGVILVDTRTLPCSRDFEKEAASPEGFKPHQCDGPWFLWLVVCLTWFS